MAGTTASPINERLIKEIKAFVGNVDKNRLCQELEACRSLKNHLVEEAKRQFPFNKEENVDEKKIKKYVKLLMGLYSAIREERDLLGKLTKKEDWDEVKKEG